MGIPKYHNSTYLVLKELEKGISLHKEIAKNVRRDKRSISYIIKKLVRNGIIEDISQTRNKYKQYRIIKHFDNYIQMFVYLPRKKTENYHPSPQALEALRKINLEGKDFRMKGPHSNETLEWMREISYKSNITTINTLPERMMQQCLKLKGIEFTVNKKLFGRPDIFIEPNICIFIDGCYWHFCPICYKNKIPNERQQQGLLRDSIVNDRLDKMGYIVIRIWQHDIIDNLIETSNNIVNLIQLKLHMESPINAT